MNYNTIIYQLLTDRFDNNDGTLADKRDRFYYNALFKTFMGGTFNGITRHIPHFKKLKITHIQPSPIQACDEYHGYKISDFYAHNSRFGTRRDLLNLTSALHQESIGFVMDCVFTHMDASGRVFKDHKKANDDMFISPDIQVDPIYREYVAKLKYKATKGNPRSFNDINPHEYVSFFGLENYPMFNLKSKQAIEFHINALTYWKKEIGFDAIRVDSGFMQPLDSTVQIREALQKEKEIEFLAEYWDFRGGFDHCAGFLDGEYDIDLISRLHYLSNSKDNLPHIFDRYIRMIDRTSYKRIVSIDSHDFPRFGGSFSEQRMASILQFALPAIPLIYYGNETGMRQLNDGRDHIAKSRDIMVFDSDSPMMVVYENLTGIRSRATKYPSWDHVQVNDGGELLSMVVDFGNTAYACIINNCEFDKPVQSKELFPNIDIFNHDVVMSRSLSTEREKLILPKRDGVLLRIGSRSD
jgi:glycosidase